MNSVVGEVEIYDSYQGHEDVLRIYDSSGSANAEASNFFDSNHTSGTIEFWWCVPTGGDNVMCFQIYEGRKSLVNDVLIRKQENGIH